jgi:hypothetical protein
MILTSLGSFNSAFRSIIAIVRIAFVPNTPRLANSPINFVYVKHQNTIEKSEIWLSIEKRRDTA